MTINITQFSRRALHAAVLSSIVAVPLHAQDSNPPSLDDPYYAAGIPLSGAYFDPGNPGLSMVVDIRSDGATFVLLGTYDFDGKPIWYAMQDRFDPTPAYPPIPEQEFHVAGSLGQVSGPVYVADGGSCIDCPPALPSIKPADVVGHEAPDTATLSWSSSSHVTVEIGDARWSMVRLPLDGALADRIAGEWQMIGWEHEYPNVHTQSANSRISVNRVDTPIINIDPAALNIGPPLPDSATHWFRLTCSSNCQPDELGYGFWAGDSRLNYDRSSSRIATFLWLDDSSGKAGIEQFIEPIVAPSCSICPIPPQPFLAQPYRFSFEVNVIGDGLTARRAQQASVLDNTGPAPVTGSILKLQKLRSFQR